MSIDTYKPEAYVEPKNGASGELTIESLRELHPDISVAEAVDVAIEETKTPDLEVKHNLARRALNRLLQEPAQMVSLEAEKVAVFRKDVKLDEAAKTRTEALELAILNDAHADNDRFDADKAHTETMRELHNAQIDMRQVEIADSAKSAEKATEVTDLQQIERIQTKELQEAMTAQHLAQQHSRLVDHVELEKKKSELRTV